MITTTLNTAEVEKNNIHIRAKEIGHKHPDNEWQLTAKRHFCFVFKLSLVLPLLVASGAMDAADSSMEYVVEQTHCFMHEPTHKLFSAIVLNADIDLTPLVLKYIFTYITVHRYNCSVKTFSWFFLSVQSVPKSFKSKRGLAQDLKRRFKN